MLYDGRLSAPPGEQGFAFSALGTSTQQQRMTRSTVLNSMTDHADRAGYFTIAESNMSAAQGYRLDFTARLHDEAHQRPERAGFSVIVVGSDGRGIELGFWRDRIWAQDDGTSVGLFQQAEGVAIDTLGATQRYSLAVKGGSYVLSMGQRAVLTGPLRNYAAFEGFPDPYEVPNFIFLGDNTTSAGASVEIERVVLRIGSCR
jgi:hypothetical protein